MTTTTKNETVITADADLPTITIVREFDAPPAKVYRAHVEPDLVARWLGPNDTPVVISEWDARTGGCYRYHAERGGEVVASFYGSFHELRPDERLVQTFTWEGAPDSVAIETMTITDLGDGRARMTAVSVYGNREDRDAMIASGMETGVVQGYEALDRLLAE